MAEPAAMVTRVIFKRSKRGETQKMSAVLTMAYTCDACGNSGQSVSASAYACPPAGWVWDATRLSEGPHACGERCWVLLESVYYSRTRQRLAPVGIETEEGATLAALPPPPPPPDEAEEAEEAHPVTVAAAGGATAQALRHVAVAVVLPEEEDEDEVTAPPQRAAKRPAPKAVPPVEAAAASGKCAACGTAMPPHAGRGRPRTKCEDCNPARARARA